jgi:hypothetical protein
MERRTYSHYKIFKEDILKLDMILICQDAQSSQLKANCNLQFQKRAGKWQVATDGLINSDVAP